MTAALELTNEDFLNVERELCARSLSKFLQRAWPQVDPSQKYLHGWHMDAICEHLEAVAYQDINRLLITVPPGTSKSTAASVMFPAWLWGPYGWPGARILSAAHGLDLAVRDNRKTRNVITSGWYQELWPTQLVGDQNEKTYFENSERGFRQASSVKGITGRRGDVLIWDDPHSPEKAYSETERETTLRVFTETLPLRLSDPINSAIIVIMQRLHHQDVAGYILENDLGYEHLMLPMEFEKDRRCITSIGFSDPRQEEGELLFPDRFPKEVVERDKKILGSFAVAGQFQQRPVPREGGLFKRAWFSTIVDAAPPGTRFVRGWDLAATTAAENANAARTAGVLLGIAPDRRVVIADSTVAREGPAGVVALLKSTAAMDGKQVRGSIPRDPGQAGKAQAESIIRELMGYPYRATPETGDKVTRATPLAAQAEAGNVVLVRGPWNKEFIEELCEFPNGKLADQVDAASRAFSELTAPASRGVKGRQR